MSVHGYLCDGCGFKVVNRVMNGGEKKCTIKVLICFSKQSLMIVGGEGFADIDWRVGQ